MQKYLRGLVMGLLVFTGTPAFCQDGLGEAVLSAQEYEIFRQALATQRAWSSVNPETMATVQADADWLKPPVGIHLAPDLVKAFNQQNAQTHQLSATFLGETSPGAGTALTGRKMITLSRPGFDQPMRHALVIMAITYYYPEDVMNEGVYVFLEKKEARWTVMHTATAWDMRLGPTP